MLGSWMRYHDPLWGFHNQHGIVVSEDDASLYLSIPKFKGDYLCVPKHSVGTQTEHKQIVFDRRLPLEQKLITLSYFADWWFVKHRSIFQCLVVQILMSTARGKT